MTPIAPSGSGAAPIKCATRRCPATSITHFMAKTNPPIMNPNSDQPKTPDPKPSASADSKSDASVAKPEVKDDAKTDAKPTATASKPRS